MTDDITTMIEAKDAEIARLQKLTAAYAALQAHQEIQSVPDISNSWTKGGKSTYRPNAGEVCFISARWEHIRCKPLDNALTPAEPAPGGNE